MSSHQFKQARPDSRELKLFEDSVLSLYLGSCAAHVFELGAICHLSEDALFRSGGPDSLIVVLEGVLESDRGWQGPGCHMFGAGEELKVAGKKATLWVFRYRTGLWQDTVLQRLQATLGKALDAADRALQAATQPEELPASDTLSDIDHPDIRQICSQLLRTTSAATAEAIFRFVQAFPYRFGNWQERASTTLARGNGMCTTKANLQVTLMRAAGLEAGFVEAPMSINVLGKLMPAAWLGMMRPNVRHYFGAVKLGGRWHAADSSFSDDSMKIYLQHFPEFSNLLPARLSEGRPYNPAAEHSGVDPFDIEVVAHLNAEMSKKSRFAPAHFEALNTRLDRAQGTWRNWVEGIHPEQSARNRSLN